ncbi:SDR family oxidoreductase [Chelativorans intermedius]|uniref:SDR family oxidoreductase n=1 Tax=Chelativorans intermedius TaxID=515947 RepID=A0ABV6D8G7_9HYPH|nr:SDR family oxidoreductase [Chelativorans intermedius]MCT8998129.1 SDR family oxidoreductase [Chelativorans intermedius]
MSARILIFGAGYSARAFARQIGPEAEEVAGTTRSAEKAVRLRQNGIRPLLYGGAGFGADILEALARATHLVVSIAPDAAGDAVLADLRAAGAGAMRALEWVGYLSTVGVYGDHDGAWVDEASECRPVSARSKWRLEAERDWAAFSRQAGVPVATLRLSGIYGPGRNAILSLEAGTARRIVKPGQVFNRIHVDDIAGALRHLMRARADGIYNVTDDMPAPPQDVVAHAAQLMGVAPPPEIPFEKADMSPMARSFYGECKRVSNRRLKETGYRLRYPDYRAALQAMWRADAWRDEPVSKMP